MARRALFFMKYSSSHHSPVPESGLVLRNVPSVQLLAIGGEERGGVPKQSPEPRL